MLTINLIHTIHKHFVDYYMVPFKKLNHIFFWANSTFTDNFIKKAKKTPCSKIANMSDKDWAEFLGPELNEGANLFEGINLFANQNLKNLLIKYLNQNENFYDALEKLHMNYQNDPEFKNTVTALGSLANGTEQESLDLLEKAYKNMQTMSEGESLDILLVEFDPAIEHFTKVKVQLEQLFSNNPKLINFLATYMENKEKELHASLDINDVQDYPKTMNIMTALADVIVGVDDPNSKKIESAKSFSDQLKLINAKDPKKSKAIQDALTEVLKQDEKMTFDRLIEEIDFGNKQTDALEQLKSAMGMHRSLFSKIVNLFYSLETKTTKLFKAFIQEQKDLNQPNNELPKP